MRRKSGAGLVLYGNTAIQRRYCSDCRSWALVIGGKLACCNLPNIAPPKRFKRESEPYWKRSLPPKKDRDAQLAEQDNRCFYCENGFGCTILKDGVPVKLRIHWDHMVPYVYNADNRRRNFVGACHVCNLLKSDRFFRTIEEAREWLASRRAAKGYL